MMEEKIITFRKPIVFGGQEFTHITLHEPNVGQLRAASKKADPLDGAATMISLIAGVPLAVVDQIPQTELEEACDFMAGFSSNGQKS